MAPCARRRPGPADRVCRTTVITALLRYTLTMNNGEGDSYDHLFNSWTKSNEVTDERLESFPDTVARDAFGARLPIIMVSIF